MRDIFGIGEIGRADRIMGLGSDFSVRGLQSNLMRAQLWTPAEITTALWLDAADSDTITLNGSTVSQWADKSGNSRHATQTTPTNQPTRGTNVVTFDGTNDVMVVLDSDAIDAVRAVYAVIKPTVDSDWETLFLKRSGTDGYVVDFGASAHRGKPRLASQSGEVHHSVVTNGVRFILTAAINGSSSHCGTQASVTTGTLSNPAPTASDLTIGGTASGTYCVAFEAHEIVMLTTLPDTSTHQKIIGSLAHKWDELLDITALVNALPSGHPYKSSPPTI